MVTKEATTIENVNSEQSDFDKKHRKRTILPPNLQLGDISNTKHFAGNDCGIVSKDAPQPKSNAFQAASASVNAIKTCENSGLLMRKMSTKRLLSLALADACNIDKQNSPPSMSPSPSTPPATKVCFSKFESS